MSFIISVVIAYLLGSISCSVLYAKLFNLPDPRTQGSQNAGATNMMRTVGMKAGAIVLVCDALKGLIAMVIGILLHQRGMALGFVALAAVVGHIFPVFFKFKGGKGVATAIGTLLAVSFWVFIFAIITWVLVLYVTRYVSLSSMVAVFVAAVYLLLGGDFASFFPYLLIAALVIWQHAPNIKRLRSGTEAKFQWKS